jgi:hypothetical protein
MSHPVPLRQNIPVMAVAIAAIALLFLLYHAPVWWVSLKAPNYPPEAFPDGVRIEFQMNGVFNGCRKVESAEIHEDIALDCVHEMDTINHYVGMYPIGAGGVIERAFSPFLVSMLGVMILGFACSRRGPRVAILAVGFGVIGTWMWLTFLGDNGLGYQSAGYIEATVKSMDQEAGENSQPEPSGIVARLRAELAEAEARERGETLPAAGAEEAGEKARFIEHLRSSYENDRRRASGALPAWDGSGRQLLLWHYEQTLSRYFNNPAEIEPMVAKVGTAFHVVFFGILAAMLLLVVGAALQLSPLVSLLVLAPALLPVIFILDYSAWLWWYGHNLNQMGAFSVKPFMPTVFGDGKVAQFSTHSYPSWGFAVMLAVSALMAVMFVLRRKQLNRLGREP